ncbi:MAG: hypothetical protein RRY35_08355 [Clostridiales bacterium]
MKTTREERSAADLQLKLLDEEVIKWQGKPTQFPLLEKVYKNRLFFRWICSAIILVVLPWIYISYCNQAAISVKQVVVGMMIVIPLLIAVSPLTMRRKLLKQTSYVITNARIFIFCNGDIAAQLPLSAIDAYRIEKMENGANMVYLGTKACLAPKHKGRIFSLFGVRDDESEICGLAFYAIADAETVIALLPTDNCLAPWDNKRRIGKAA